MSRIAGALKEIRNITWIKIPYLPSVERYVQTGDPQALAKVTPFGRMNSYWSRTLTDALRPVEAWEDEDHRVVHVLAAAGFDEALWEWVSRQLETEQHDQDLHAVVRQAMLSRGSAEAELAAQTLRYVRTLVRHGKPTSAGRWLLSLPPEKLKAQVRRMTSEHPLAAIAELVTSAAPERTADLADLLLSPGGDREPEPEPRVAEALLKQGGQTFIPNILAAFDKSKNEGTRFDVACLLFERDRQRFRQLAFDAARVLLGTSAGDFDHIDCGKWLMRNFGEQALPVLIKYFAGQRWDSRSGSQILAEAVATAGSGAAPLVLAALDACHARFEKYAQGDKAKQRDEPWWLREEVTLREAAVDHLIALSDPSHSQRILKELRDGLALADSSAVIAFLGLAAKWDMSRLEGDVWGLLGHKSKAVRDAAARALARLGDAAVPKAAELLGHKKADVRSAAVTLLAVAATPKALAELEGRLDDEPNDDVRDQMLLGLADAWEKQGRRITRKDVEARIANAAAAGKLKDPVAAWANPAKLPPLKWKEGGDALNRDAAAYLLYRQSRAKEIRPDVEAAPLYKLIDRSTSGAFARAVLRGFLGSKQEAGDRWALAIAGLLGDDRLVPELAGQVREWVDKNRGKLAEYAVQALALLGSDAALLAVDAMAIRYRSRMKNVGRAAAEAFAGAAEHLGITPEELGDRVVPWLGFEPGKPRIIEAGKTRIEATIGMDLKLAFRDVEKNKPIKSLPKSAPAEVLAELKEVSANLKEVVKAQVLRLENLLVRQRRWPAARWKELFLRHPLLLPFAVRLVWGHYEDGSGKRLGTFRALEDRSLTTRQDEPYDLPDTGTIGMVHPLELEEAERLAWRNHLGDYEIEPPFPQLEREVVAVTPELAGVKVYRELAGTSINAMTFKGRAERLGWSRGSVVDAGGISSYYKSFPSAGVDVFLGTDDFYIGIDMYSDIKLGEVMFVRHGSVKVGSYTYDEPSKEDDPRVIPMGEAPPVVFSEAMGDLQKIAGKKRGAADEE